MNGMKTPSDWLGSLQAILRLYRKLYNEGRIPKNGSAYKRMKVLEYKVRKGKK
jgi:hypothetical protein